MFSRRSASVSGTITTTNSNKGGDEGGEYNEIKTKIKINNSNSNIEGIDNSEMNNKKFLFDLTTQKDWDQVKSFLHSTDISKQIKDDAMQYRDEYGRNALIVALGRDGASFDIVKLMVQVGGDSVLKVKDNDGSNALHYACYENASLQCIELLTSLSSLEDITATDNNDTPVDYLLQRSPPQFDKINVILKKWSKLDPNAQAFPESNTLTLILQLSESDQDKVLESTIIRKILQVKFSSPKFLALSMMDLYVQLAVIIVYSFLLGDVLRGESDSSYCVAILTISFIWDFIQEISKFMNTSLTMYVSDAVNYLDGLQLVLLLWTISNLYSHDDDYRNHWGSETLYIIATAVPWLKLLFVIGNLSYSIAVFSVAFIQIIGALIPFLVTTILFLLMFSHAYHTWSIFHEDICTAANEGLFDEEWTCKLSKSYVQSLSMFLTTDFAFLDGGEYQNWKTLLSWFYAFAIGILMLNILIAVISFHFDNNYQNGQRAFWRNRLLHVRQSQSLLSFFSILPLCGNDEQGKTDNQSDRIIFGIDHNHTFLDSLDKADGAAFFAWWYYYWSDSWGECPNNILEIVPPMKTRFYYFFHKASWNEVAFPGRVFDNIFTGNAYYITAVGWKCFPARILSVLIFALVVILMLLVFILGSISLGLLWPDFVKEMLFVSDKDEESEEGLTGNDELNDLKEQLVVDIKRELMVESAELKSGISELKAENVELKSLIMQLIQKK